MPCRNCCDACDGNHPKTWTVTIPGSAGPVVLTRSGGSLGGCTWEWTGEQASGCAGQPTMGRVRLFTTVFQFQLFVSEPDGTLLWEWFIVDDLPRKCLEDLTGWQFVPRSLECPDNPGSPTVEPGPVSTCGCPCSTCCDACGEYTPSWWHVTIGGKTYKVFRAITDDTDASDVATCVWRRQISRDVCDLAAEWIEIRVIRDSSVGAAFPYKIECELIEADESSHTLWRKQSVSALSCNAASHELTKVSGECSGNVTVAGTKMRFCPEEGSSQCDLCQIDTIPNQYEIDLSGISDGSCEDCTDLNGTYIVTSIGQCLWRLDFEPSACGYETITLLTSVNGFRVILSGPSATNLEFVNNAMPAPSDCMYDGAEADGVSFVAACDHLSATATATALP